VKRALACLSAAVLLVAAPAVAASPKATPAGGKVDEVVSRLQARYDDTKDFTADFDQTVEAATLGQPLESSGKVYFKRPGKMRWEFEKSEKQTIVADGQMLWVYQPEHHQVLKAPFRAAFQSATPVSFLFGVGQLAKDFDASLLSPAKTGALRLKLVPKQEREIGVLVLDVDPKTYDILAAEVTDPLGNVTRLRFLSMKRDVGLDDAKFTFQPPPGTDVVQSPGNP